MPETAAGYNSVVPGLRFRVSPCVNMRFTAIPGWGGSRVTSYGKGSRLQFFPLRDDVSIRENQRPRVWLCCTVEAEPCFENGDDRV
jgi:hypothetical protein